MNSNYFGSTEKNYSSQEKVCGYLSHCDLVSPWFRGGVFMWNCTCKYPSLRWYYFMVGKWLRFTVSVDVCERDVNICYVFSNMVEKVIDCFVLVQITQRQMLSEMGKRKIILKCIDYEPKWKIIYVVVWNIGLWWQILLHLHSASIMIEIRSHLFPQYTKKQMIVYVEFHHFHSAGLFDLSLCVWEVRLWFHSGTKCSRYLKLARKRWRKQ